MEFLYSIFIAPVEYIVEFVFLFIRIRFSVFGVMGAVLGVSIIINFLALPLYAVADAVTEKERALQRRLAPRVKRIKAAFKGDEQFMMLSTYYRQNNYNPLYSLRSSLSVLFEIPFFIAAYHYLSNCQDLLGQSFWIFKDLSKPDALISFTAGSRVIAVNVLPILMTLINLASGAVYLKKSSVQEKVQVFGLAAVFLVILYNSPCGLVLYWIFNNLFSLCKNLFVKLKLPKNSLYALFVFALVFVTAFFFLKKPDTHLIKKMVLLVITVFFAALPVAYHFAKDKPFFKKAAALVFDPEITPAEKRIFYISCAALAVFFGLVLPASVISTSPIEFSFIGKTDSPLFYIANAFCFFAGVFVFWPAVIFNISGDKAKRVLTMLMFTVLLTSFANVYVFKSDYGSLNFLLLIHESVANVPKIFIVLSLVFPAAVFAFSAFLTKQKIQKYVPLCIVSVLLAEAGFGLYKTHAIKKEFVSYKISREKNGFDAFEDWAKITPVFHFSKTGKNVVVLFLDRAISGFLPYIIEQFPELAEQYDGFVYYPNCLSFGRLTNTGTPSMLGGYEYTPAEMEKRDTELLVDKHNEATCVLPKLFQNAGFDALVSDVPWANYTLSGDLSAFEKNGIPATWQNGKYTQEYYKIIGEPDKTAVLYKVCKKQVLTFSIVQSLVPVLRTIFSYTMQAGISSISDDAFANNFSTLYFLSKLTDFTSEKSTYTFIGNDVTHSPVHLKSPEYFVEDSAEEDCGVYVPRAGKDVAHYHVNAAALKILPRWFSHLKENGCWDNTRIIIVADHGRDIYLDCFNRFEDPLMPAWYNPLLLVKDFDARGMLRTDNAFVTNADTLFFAKKDLPVSNANPFTQKEFERDLSNGAEVYGHSDWNCTGQRTWKKFGLDPKDAWVVKDNIFDPENWKPLSEAE